MIVEWADYRIRSDALGYALERKLPSRWKHVSTHNSLAQAAQGLLQYRVRTETADCVIKAELHASARVSTAELIAKIEAIADEILEAMNVRD